MNEEQLLFIDLSARLSYGVIVRHADPFIDNYGSETGEFWYKRGYLCNINTLDDITTTIIESKGSDEEGCEHICPLERTVPYLRSLSSMTEEELEELNTLTYHNISVQDNTLCGYICGNELEDVFDWLNKKMFAYRHINGKNMFELGLAIEVTEDNNPYKLENNYERK